MKGNESTDYSATSNSGREHLSMEVSDAKNDDFKQVVFTAFLNQPDSSSEEDGNVVVIPPDPSDVHALRVFLEDGEFDPRLRTTTSIAPRACRKLLEQLEGLSECARGILARVEGRSRSF